MSHLKLFAPPSTALRDTAEGEDAVADAAAPTILSFQLHRDRRHNCAFTGMLERARKLHANRACPECRYPVIRPLELADAVLNENQMPLPGTATLVGFHCQACHYEWPA